MSSSIAKSSFSPDPVMPHRLGLYLGQSSKSGSTAYFQVTTGSKSREHTADKIHPGSASQALLHMCILCNPSILSNMVQYVPHLHTKQGTERTDNLDNVSRHLDSPVLSLAVGNNFQMCTVTATGWGTADSFKEPRRAVSTFWGDEGRCRLCWRQSTLSEGNYTVF